MVDNKNVPYCIVSSQYHHVHTETQKVPQVGWTHLFLDKAVAHRTLLTLVCGSVVEIVQLAFVTLVPDEALATQAGPVAVTLHGDGAHRVTVTGCRRTKDSGWEHEDMGDK